MVTSDSDVITPFIFPHSLNLNTEVEEARAVLDRVGDNMKSLGQATVLYGKPYKQENPVLAATTSP